MFFVIQGSKLARLPRPDSILEVLLINCKFVYHELVSKRYQRMLAYLISGDLRSQIHDLIYTVPRGFIYGCGDLIFSSHMIFTLVFVLTYQKYGTKR